MVERNGLMEFSKGNAATDVENAADACVETMLVGGGNCVQN